VLFRTDGTPVAIADAQGRGAALTLLKRLAVVGLCLAAVYAPSSVLAQAQQTLPTRDELTGPAEIEPPRSTRLQVDGDIERAPCPLADPAYARITVDIDRAAFVGLKGMTEAEIEPLYRPYIGQARSVSDLCEIRDAVATALRRRGYLAAVQIPAQEIDGGEVRFEVLYARLTAIRVRGDAGRSERQIAALLQQLTKDEVFNQRTAERYLLLSRDLPGLDVRLTLKPTGRPGEVLGEVTVIRQLVEADFNLQNLGAEDTGRFGAQARVRFNGLTGMGDQTTVALYSTTDIEEQQVLQLGHEFRLGADGLEIAARLTHAWTEPDLAPSEDLLQARTLFGNIAARYPFLRTQNQNLFGSVGLDYVDQSVEFDGFEIAEDRLRVAYVRLDGDLLDARSDVAPRWRLNWSAELRKGLGVFDASPAPGSTSTGTPSSRADGVPDALVARASATADVILSPHLTLTASALAQASESALLSFEELSFGSYTIGRGYDPGVLLGDDGAGLSLELRLDRLTPFRGVAFQPFVFVEAAKVWNRDSEPDDLASAGLGVRASFADRFRLDVAVAFPTAAAGLQTEREDPRLLLSFTTRLWPWSLNR
jgi:hemolysin activation/secretion protein